MILLQITILLMLKEKSSMPLIELTNIKRITMKYNMMDLLLDTYFLRTWVISRREQQYL
jgi:hypothetical protein